MFWLLSFCQRQWSVPCSFHNFSQEPELTSPTVDYKGEQNLWSEDCVFSKKLLPLKKKKVIPKKEKEDNQQPIA